jgi:hypothetical protein
MTSQFAFAAFLAVSLASFSPQSEAACIQSGSKEFVQLSGTVRYKVFPGPPNFEDVRKGDYPEPEYILELSSPICVVGDEFVEPTLAIWTIQLDSTGTSLRPLVNHRVVAALENFEGGATAHYHASVTAYLYDISTSDDITLEYGTAATTVRAFYDALGAGRGEEAATYIVPERRHGPFSPEAITKFYGNLVEPLTLVFLNQSGLDSYFVQYQFRGAMGGQ